MSVSEIWPNCPSCPEIKKKIDQIYLALLGTDGTGMKEGLVFELTQLKQREGISMSWVNFGKPIIIAVLASSLTYVCTVILPHLHF